MSANAQSAAGAVYSPGRAWYIVAILSLFYAISFVDRLILALLVEPVSAEFGLTDLHQGLLLGAGFAIVYSLAGLPLAHFIDRHQRRLIVAIGAVVWGVTTIASGFAQNAETLFVCRAGVAIGEAVLSPAAVSLISDLFPREKRSLPVSIYVGVSQMMGVGSFVLGAAALDLAEAWAPTLQAEPWRITLVIVGLPSIILAGIMMLTTREPPRTGEKAPNNQDSSLAAFFRHYGAHWAFYTALFIGVGTSAMMFFSLSAWMPSLLIRGYGVSPAEAGYLLGIVGVPAGLGGAFLWPWIAKLIGRKSAVSGLMLCLVASVTITATAIVIAMQAQSVLWLLIGVAVAMTAVSANAPVIPIIIQTVAPGRMHARLVSISFLCSNLIGFAIGPFLTPVFAGAWEGDPRALGHGLATLAMCVGPFVFVLFTLGLITGRRARLGEEAAVPT
ncbi:MAG: MFS transporter [Hyphomonadaceae bacterium]